eukprot:488230_1
MDLSAFGIIKRHTLILKDNTLTADFVLSIYELLDEQQHSTLHQKSINSHQNQSYDTFHALSLDDDDYKQKQETHNTNTALNDINGLDFWNCYFDNDLSTSSLLSDVIMVFSDITSIQKLYFSNNLLTDNHLQTLTNGLIYLYDLKELRIISNEITYLSLNYLCDLFSNKDCKLKQTLQILDLSDNHQLIETNENAIQSFELFVYMLSETNIEILKLSNSPHLCSNHVYILSQWILNDTLCQLRHLDLSQNICSLLFIQSLCNIINRNNCYIESLVLNNCQFSKDSAKYLGMNLYLNNKLQCLCLNGMHLNPFIAFANSENEIRVSKLYLNNLLTRTQNGWHELSYGSISDAIVNIISEKCLYLQELYMNRGDLHNDEVSDLAAFLAQYAWIRKISLCYNALNHGCLKTLSHAVRASKKEAVKQTKIYCQVIVECIERYLSNEIGVKNKLDMNRFTSDISYYVVEYLFKDPMDGIRCILLQGNVSINVQFTANFRNCDLLDAKILSKLAKTRYDGRNDRDSMSHMKHKQITWSKLLSQ